MIDNEVTLVEAQSKLSTALSLIMEVNGAIIIMDEAIGQKSTNELSVLDRIIKDVLTLRTCVRKKIGMPG